MRWLCPKCRTKDTISITVQNQTPESVISLQNQGTESPEIETNVDVNKGTVAGTSNGYWISNIQPATVLCLKYKRNIWD